jgi:hypothetical protein
MPGPESSADKEPAVKTKKLILAVSAAALFASAGCDLFTGALEDRMAPVPLFSDGTIYQDGNVVELVASASPAVITASFTAEPGADISWTELSDHGINLTGVVNTSSESALTITVANGDFGLYEAVKIAKLRCTVSKSNRKRDYDFNFLIYNSTFAFVKPGGTGSGLSPDDPAGDINVALLLKNKVAVAAGTYNVLYSSTPENDTSVYITNGKSLYGGYDPETWQRDFRKNITTIQDLSEDAGVTRAVTITGTDESGCELNGFKIISGTRMTGPANDTCAVYVTGNGAGEKIIRNNAVSCPEGESHYSTYNLVYVALNSTKITIENNRFTNVKNSYQLYPIMVTGSSSITIIDNVIAINEVTGEADDTNSTMFYGIEINNGSGTYTINNNTISLNSFTSTFFGEAKVGGAYIFGNTINLTMTGNTISIKNVNVGIDDSLFYSGIELQNSIYGKISGNTVSSPEIIHKSSYGPIYSRSIFCNISKSAAGVLNFSGNILLGPTIDVRGYPGTDLDRHEIIGLKIEAISTTELEISHNAISAGTASNFDVAEPEFFFTGSGIYLASDGNIAPVTISGNAVKGPIIHLKTNDTAAMTASAIYLSSIDQDNINIYNNIISGGAIYDTDNAEGSWTAGLALLGSPIYKVANNTIQSGLHPQNSYCLFTDGGNAARQLSNNIFISAGSSVNRYFLYEKEHAIMSCENNLFVNAGTGDNYLMKDEGYVNITSLSDDVKLEIETTLEAEDNIANNNVLNLFVNYPGRDSDPMTHLDNNWRLAHTAPDAAKTGAPRDPLGLNYEDDITGAPRGQNWSMGAYEYSSD